MDLPRDLPIVRRRVVRLAVLDVADRLLLFHTHDLTYPELGTWWELPGGGIDPGETYVDAAVRELREETGIVITITDVGKPTWRRQASFRHHGERRLQDEVVAVVRLTVAGPAIDESGRVGYETEDYFDYRWWPVAEVIASDALFYPRRLPVLLDRLLGGEEITEPLELWS